MPAGLKAGVQQRYTLTLIAVEIPTWHFVCHAVCEVSHDGLNARCCVQAHRHNRILAFVERERPAHGPSPFGFGFEVRGLGSGSGRVRLGLGSGSGSGSVPSGFGFGFGSFPCTARAGLGISSTHASSRQLRSAAQPNNSPSSICPLSGSSTRSSRQ